MERMGCIRLIVCFILNSHLSLATIKVPFMNNMVLGRTFDYSKSLVGNDIYSAAEQQNVVSTNNEKYTHNFEIINSARDVMDVLDVSGELSLQVMAGVVNVEGKGAYLKTTSENENSVEVLAQTSFTTKTERLRETARPTITDWQNADLIGQHYIESVTYGGFLIASLKFTAKKTEEKEKISAAVKADVTTAKVDVSLEGLFDKLVSSTKDSSELTITYTSSLIPDIIPTDYKSLLQVIRNFPQQVKSTQNGFGVPIEVRLRELSFLDNGIPPFRITPQLEDELKEFANSYHDLKTTSDEIAKSLENTRLKKKQEKRFGKLNAQIWEIMEVFFSTIDNLDLNEDKAQKIGQLKKAKKKYGNLPGYYMRKFKRLIRQFPLYEFHDIEEIPLDIEKMKDVLKDQENKFTSIKKLTSGTNEAVSFPQKDSGNYMLAAGKGTDMAKIMACFSAKSIGGPQVQTFLSYGTMDRPNEFVIATNEKAKLVVTRRDIESEFASDFDINDDAWHAWCISWSDAGNIDIYKDGTKVQESKTGVAAGTTIEKGGLWMVGQAQLNFIPVGQDKAYRGEITNVNIFEQSDDLLGEKASESTCKEYYGKIVRLWHDFRRAKVGEVRALEQNTACPSNFTSRDFLAITKERGRYIY